MSFDVLSCPICVRPLLGSDGGNFLECAHGHKYVFEDGELVKTTGIVEMLEAKTRDMSNEMARVAWEAEEKAREEYEQMREDHDFVHNPPHYTYSEIEPIDVVEAWQVGFHLGNVLKYVARAAWKKDMLQDLRKARWYLDRKIKQLESANE